MRLVVTISDISQVISTGFLLSQHVTHTVQTRVSNKKKMLEDYQYDFYTLHICGKSYNKEIFIFHERFLKYI